MKDKNPPFNADELEPSGSGSLKSKNHANIHRNNFLIKINTL